MKNLISIFPILFVIFFSACEVESGESGYPRTLQGKIAYDAVENRTSQALHLLDLMTKVSHYAEAPADEKEGIKNYYLSQYTITNKDDSWNLKSNKEEIVFSHNQKSINEDGAIWTVKVSVKLWDGKVATLIEDKNFRVEYLEDKNWKLTTSELLYYHLRYGYSYPTDNKSNAELFIRASKAHDKSSGLFDFRIEEGNGDLNYDYTDIKYKISAPLLYTYASSNLTIHTGEIDITVDEDKIKAKILAGYYYPLVEITFKNITEVY